MARFIMVGGICFVTNLTILYCGTSLLGWYYLISMTASIVVANTLGWLLNRFWTFTDSRHPLWVEYIRYMSVSFLSTLISLMLMVVSVSLAGIHYMLASAIIALLMLLFNFIAHRNWSFSASGHSSTRS